MVNENRIVPVTKMDLISLFGSVAALMLDLSGAEPVILDPVEMGVFEVESNGIYLLSEPAKSIDFAATATAATVVFVPGYDYEGITLAGAAVEPGEGSILPEAEPNAFYGAALQSGSIVIAPIQLNRAGA